MLGLAHLPPYLLLGTGAVIGYARKIYQPVLDWIDRRMWVSVEAVQPDLSYRYLDAWLNAQEGQAKIKNLYAKHTLGEETKGGILLVPGFGTNYMWWNKRPVIVSRSKMDTPIYSGPIETIKLRLAFTKRSEVKKILDEGERLYTLLVSAREPGVYLWENSNWSKSTTKLRPLSSVILPEGQAESILADFRLFLSREQWYLDMGIPYHYGALFSGVPGSGKTSFISAIAHELRASLYVLDIGTKAMTEGTLSDAINSIPPHSILVLEDIDAVAPKRDKAATDQINFSTLLNTLDGFLSAHGIIVCMTTNHPEVLDSALIREGRMNIKQHFAYATDWQIRAMFRKFNPDADLTAEDAFAAGYENQETAMCRVQQDLFTTKG